MSNSRKIQESSSKTLRQLASIQENRFCFDCGQRGPTYVNMTIGSFVCTACGGALRKYNQRVKSLSMSNFNTQEVNFLKRRGNHACGKIYLALCDGKEPDERGSNFDDYLRLKYQVQRWYRSPEPSIEEEALHKNEEALARASENATAKVNHISNNASAGLLIPTTRTLSISFSKPVVTTSSQPSTESTSINVSNSSISFTTPDSSSVLQGPYQPQTSLFSAPAAVTSPTPKPADSHNSEVPLDPFTEYVAARPQQSIFRAPLVSPPQHFQSSQTLAFPTAFNTPSIPPQPMTSTAAAAAFPTSSAFSASSPQVDKYAALAELDRLGKMEANAKTKPSSFTAFSPSMRSPLQEMSFTPQNPFQSPTFGPNNPFVSINDPASFTMPSTPTIPSATMGQNSFNPFINAR